MKIEAHNAGKSCRPCDFVAILPEINLYQMFQGGKVTHYFHRVISKSGVSSKDVIRLAVKNLKAYDNPKIGQFDNVLLATP